MAPDTLPAQMAQRHATELALRQPYMLQTSVERQTEDEEDASALTLSDLLGMILKHKWTLLLVILVSTGIAGINTFLLRPTYRATAVLQIERAAARVVDFQHGNVDLDQASVDEYLGLKTQYELLRSRSLAERVIDDLQLDRSRSAVAPLVAASGAKTKALAAAPAPAGDGFVGRIISGYRKLSTPAVTDPDTL